MDRAEKEAFTRQVGAFVARRIAAEVGPLQIRLAQAEAENAALRARIKTIEDHDGNKVLILRLVQEEVAKLPAPRDGRDADPDEVARMVAAEVARAVAELPEPRDGKDADPEAIARMVSAEVERAIAELPVPRDGKDADPDEVARMVAAEVARAVAALPAPKDGRDANPDEIAALVTGEVTKAVASLPRPRDVTDAVIDRAGELVLTFSDGSTKSLGVVVGRDGQDVDMDQVRASIEQRVAAIPRPRDGLDGLGFDDLSVEHDGLRTFTFKFERDGRVKEFAFQLPVVIDRGVFKGGATYAAGDGVTWAGSYWIAQRETAEKPGEHDSWRMAVRKGRDGKAARS